MKYILHKLHIPSGKEVEEDIERVDKSLTDMYLLKIIYSEINDWNSKQPGVWQYWITDLSIE